MGLEIEFSAFSITSMGDNFPYGCARFSASHSCRIHTWRKRAGSISRWLTLQCPMCTYFSLFFYLFVLHFSMGVSLAVDFGMLPHLNLCDFGEHSKPSHSCSSGKFCTVLDSNWKSPEWSVPGACSNLWWGFLTPLTWHLTCMCKHF